MRTLLLGVLLAVAAVLCFGLLRSSPEERTRLPPNEVQRIETALPQLQRTRVVQSDERGPASGEGAELTIHVRDTMSEDVPGVKANLVGVRLEQERTSDHNGKLHWDSLAPGRYRWALRSHRAAQMRPPHEASAGRDPKMTFDFAVPSRGPPGLSGWIDAKAGESISLEVTVYQPTKVTGQLALAGTLASPAAIHVFACGNFSRGTLKGSARLSEAEIVVEEPGRFELVLSPGTKSLSAVWQHGDQVMLVTRNFQILEGETHDLGVLTPRDDAVTPIAVRFDDNAGNPLSSLAAIGVEEPVLAARFHAVGRASYGELDQYLLELRGVSWTLIGLSPGDWQFSARLQNTKSLPGVECPESSAASVTLPTNKPVELAFAVRSRMALSVLPIAPESESLIRIQVFAMNLDTDEVVRAKGYSGQRFELMVDPGRQMLWITSQRYGLEDKANIYAEGQVVVSSESDRLRETTVELLLVPARRWEGRVARAEERDRNPVVVSFNIAGFPETAKGLIHAKADEEGRIVLSGIPPHRDPISIPRFQVRWK